MRAFEIVETLPAPPDAVWAVAGDPARFPDWMAGLRRVDPPADGELAPGVELAAEVAGAGHGPRETRLTLAEWDPPRGFALAAGAAGSGTLYRYRFAPAAEGRETRAVLTAEIELSGKWRLLAWLIKRGMKRADGGQLRALRRLVVG